MKYECVFDVFPAQTKSFIRSHSHWFCIQVLKREAFITFYDKTPGFAPEGQGTLRASTLQGCGPDTETRMNDTWHVVCYGRMFTSPLHPRSVRFRRPCCCHRATARSTATWWSGNPKFSLFSLWTTFLGFSVSLTPYLWCRWLVGSCEMMKRTSLRESTRIAMFPCVQVSKCWWESLWGRRSQMVQVRCFKNSLQFVCDLCSKLHGNWCWYGAC